MGTTQVPVARATTIGGIRMSAALGAKPGNRRFAITFLASNWILRLLLPMPTSSAVTSMKLASEDGGEELDASRRPRKSPSSPSIRMSSSVAASPEREHPYAPVDELAGVVSVVRATCAGAGSDSRPDHVRRIHPLRARAARY